MKKMKKKYKNNKSYKINKNNKSFNSVIMNNSMILRPLSIKKQIKSFNNMNKNKDNRNNNRIISCKIVKYLNYHLWKCLRSQFNKINLKSINQS